MSKRNGPKISRKIVDKSLPQIDLKQEGAHFVPEDQKIEIIVHWKASKGQQFEPEVINPVHAFAVKDGKLKIINRNLLDSSYVFNIDEVKAAFIMPMEVV